jgi:PucR C-terminal helix-turn-helix domain/GGDEF-like domain
VGRESLVYSGGGMAAQATLVEELAARFLARREELGDEMVERIRERVPEFAEFGGPELWEVVRASCVTNLETGFSSLAGDRSLPDSIPADARELALLTARADLSVAALLASYRVGHRMIWQAWADAIEREAPDDEARREALSAVSDFLFGYVDRLATFLTREHTAERDRFMRSREQRRTQLVRDVIDGADPDPAEAMRELDYDLRLEHLALVIRGADPERVARDLGRALDAPHRLVISLARDTAWAWLGRTRAFAVPERVEAPEGTVVSIGDPAAGSAGFRRSHRQARDAHAVALRARPEGALVRYDEVALESLIGSDDGRADDFIARELRGLDGADARSDRLRETLRAYFASGQNASAAAALLGVHEHTVSYRLRTIEERLGRPVTARRAELETALRLLKLRSTGS